MAFTKMWDPNKRTYVTVNEKYADKYKSQGLTTDLPSKEQISQYTKEAKSGRIPKGPDPGPTPRQGTTDPVGPSPQPLESDMGGTSTVELGRMYASGNQGAKEELLRRGAIKINEQGFEQLVPGWQQIQPGQVSSTPAAGSITLKDLTDEQLRKAELGARQVSVDPINEKKEMARRGLQPLPLVKAEKPLSELPKLTGVETIKRYQPTQAMPEVEQGPNIREQLKEQRKNLAMQGFLEAFGKTQSQLAQEREAVGRQAQEQRRIARVEDTMARRGAEQLQARGGLSMSGAASQSALGQDILQSNILGGISQREQLGRADIERRLSEAQQARDMGIARAGAEAEISDLESQLRQQEADQAFQREQQLLAEERAYQSREAALDRAFTMSREEADRQFTLARDQSLAATQRERDVFLAQLEQDNAILEAQLQQARDTNNAVLERQILEIKHQNDLALEGVRSANDMAQIRERGAQDRASIKARGTETTQDRAAEPKQEQQGLSLKDADKTLKNSLGFSVDDLYTQRDPRMVDRMQTQIAQVIAQLIMNNRISDTTADQLADQYGITDAQAEQAFLSIQPVGGMR